MQDVTAREEATWKGPALGQPFPSSLRSRVKSCCPPPSHPMRLRAKPASAGAPAALRMARSSHSVTPQLFTHMSFQTSQSPFQQLDATRAHHCLVPVKSPPHELHRQVLTHQTGPSWEPRTQVRAWEGSQRLSAPPALPPGMLEPSPTILPSALPLPHPGPASKAVSCTLLF